jgi:hypothetical protein
VTGKPTVKWLARCHQVCLLERYMLESSSGFR